MQPLPPPEKTKEEIVLFFKFYEPIKEDGITIGAIYVGGKEKDIVKLRATLQTLKIGSSGFPFVLDDNNNIVFSTKRLNVHCWVSKMGVKLKKWGLQEDFSVKKCGL